MRGSRFVRRLSESRAPHPASRRSANDAGPRETVVKATMIPAEEGGHESQTGGRREQQPHQRAEKRTAEVERRSVAFRHDADADRHLPERLSAGRERHQIAAVLYEQ